MNKNTLNSILIFVVGAAVGSAVTYKVVKTKFEQIAQEEIDAAKAYYSGKKVKMEESESVDRSGDVMLESSVEPNKPDLKDYAAMVSKTGYARGYIKEENEKEGEYADIDDDDDKPYVISPEEFDTLDEYDCDTFYYFADGVVTDMMEDVIDEEDVEEYIGHESLTHFGEYSDDAVHVRNDLFRCDYEILRDERNYHDVYPHPEED